MANFKDMTGYEFNGCRVLHREGSNKRGLAMWQVQCHCGNVFVTAGSSIRNGETNSCGCSHKKAAKKMGLNNKTHGETHSRLYDIWRNMKYRCNKKEHKSYKYYGGRGIEVCDEWMKSYEIFKEWALNNGYNETLTIDRIDVEGNYEPDNCRWATFKEQGRNRRNNKLFNYNGKILTQSEICEITGLSKYQVNKKFSRETIRSE